MTRPALRQDGHSADTRGRFRRVASGSIVVTGFVGSHTAVLRDDAGDRLSTLIWGDALHVIETSGDRVRVQARGLQGWVDASSVSDRSLLELYVIDVGQGDGMLLKTPGGAWHLIDAGMASRDQMTKKGAANFVRWKFIRDLGRDKVSLDSVVVTHNDLDHYGGLVDLFSGRLYDGRTFDIEVGRLYHGGLGRFRSAPTLGAFEEAEVDPFPQSDQGLRRESRFVTELLDDRDSFANPAREFQPRFGEYADLAGRVPGEVRRLSHLDGFLPGYGPGEDDVEIRVLGPILERIGEDRFGLRILGSDGETLNGHSVVLRVDYGTCRILLTGDLNSQSQKLLLSYQPAEEFAADVAKACHHGAEDVHLGFVQAMQPKATVISSGDNEDYAHPRPVLMGAAGRHGREGTDPKGRTLPPLIYSTELARSLKLAYASSVLVKKTDEVERPTGFDVAAGKTEPAFRPLPQTPLSTDLIYGLVNVRTDGEHILCATMEEEGNDFDVKVFR
jgi:beta-lactamase superfamily II metal-dependent hydrolase